MVFFNRVFLAFVFCIKVLPNLVTTHIVAPTKPVAALRKVPLRGTQPGTYGDFTTPIRIHGKSSDNSGLWRETLANQGGHCPTL
jgi:hypothetical protein